MLPNEKNDLMYLINILEYIGKTWKYTEGINDPDELFELNDQMNLNASLTLIANIGENVSKITEKLKKEYKDVEWQKIKNFRNKVVHDYVGIDLAILYEAITNDFSIIKKEIEKIIKEQVERNVFNIEEIELCKKSKYYKYIEFDKIM